MFRVKTNYHCNIIFHIDGVLPTKSLSIKTNLKYKNSYLLVASYYLLTYRNKLELFRRFLCENLLDSSI
jgi:hypothetical protein